MSVRDERSRLFVALELPETAREALVRWRASALRGIDGLRLEHEEDLHVTMCFLGSQAATEVDAIAAACGVLAEWPPALLRVDAPIWLSPRVLAVKLDDSDRALAEAQSRLSDALEAGGWYRPEDRPFLAHVTVARVRDGARVQAAELDAPPALALTASRVTLFRSGVSLSGPRYEALAKVGLGGGP